VAGLLIELEDEISELDINPLMVSEAAAFACDARIVLSKK
jgi:succinyl-CoA synthetase beta subunit